LTSTTRLWVGTLVKDVPLYLPSLMRGGAAYLAIRNRAERLEPAPDRSGFRCDWQWTSELHAPKLIPSLGRHLMRRALAEDPILRSDAPQPSDPEPQVSFLIGHSGRERLPHLLATLQSIAAQQAATVECIVVEQDTHPQLAPHMPPWVRLIHTPPPTQTMPYCRSWAFNVAAQHARSAVLVLHDNDMLVPASYAARILRRIREGYDVVNLKRFIFHLTQAHTDAVFAGRAGLLDAPPEVVVQNLEGGGSVAITRAGFDGIGGMDESFIGWGGEDNEFWERAQTLRPWPWANLPLVHLSHSAQPGKRDAHYRTAKRYRSLTQIAPPERIGHLRSIPQGHMNGPAGWRDAIAERAQ
jgi:glycosyl transferase family 7 (putative galactosyltransferase)